jgi:serine protease AprX
MVIMKRTSASFGVAVVALLAALAVSVSGQHGPTLSHDVAAHSAGQRGHRIIVQADASALASLRGRGFGVLRRQMQGAVAMDVSDEQLEALSRNPAIAHISGDLRVFGDMAVTNKVTGASSVWQGTSGLLGIGGTPGYNGTGITVAVLDSGIAPHTALGPRVIGRVNLVSDEPTVSGDPYGHGTHVAGIAGGDGSAAKYVTSAYSGGSAPAINLIDVRVLGRDGSGLTSDVIAGLDWVVANRKKYNIRVVNLSLGHPVTEPSAFDPLDQAVERAVAQGIVVVAAAGNYGQTATGAPILGGVTSPGNSPYAITVGAIDTKGTLDTSDDSVAPYSSRGPTKYDLVVKPDVVAPGTRIVSLEAYKSYLSTTYPQWHVAGRGTNAYLRLSGTSMATPVVSGGIALLLNAQPSLSPAQVKMALQMGARYSVSGGLLAAGTGTVNFPQTLTIAQNGLVPNLLNTVSNVLGSGSGAAFRDDGSMTDRIYDGRGLRLLSLRDLGWLFQGADNAEWGVLNLLGLSNPLASMSANRLLWGEIADWIDGDYCKWGDPIRSSSGQVVVWGSSDSVDGDVVVWGSSVVKDGR